MCHTKVYYDFIMPIDFAFVLQTVLTNVLAHLDCPKDYWALRNACKSIRKVFDRFPLTTWWKYRQLVLKPFMKKALIKQQGLIKYGWILPIDQLDNSIPPLVQNEHGRAEGHMLWIGTFARASRSINCQRSIERSFHKTNLVSHLNENQSLVWLQVPNTFDALVRFRFNVPVTRCKCFISSMEFLVRDCVPAGEWIYWDDGLPEISSVFIGTSPLTIEATIDSSLDLVATIECDNVYYESKIRFDHFSRLCLLSEQTLPNGWTVSGGRLRGPRVSE